MRNLCLMTPWGNADDQEKICEGVRRFSTPSHGGYLVEAAKLAEMPAGLRAIKSYAGHSIDGGRWYEEDCDWAIVALAFPELFQPFNVLAAIETAMPDWVSWSERAKAWLRSPEGAAVCEIAARYEAENGQKFRMGWECTGGSGWQAGARNIAGDVEISIDFPGDSRYKMPFGPFAEDDVERAGGRIIGRKAT